MRAFGSRSWPFGCVPRPRRSVAAAGGSL